MGDGVTWARLLPALVMINEPAVPAVISVRLLNSETVPVALTRCPSATAVGQVMQKTKIPSDVAGLASASASSSWRKKPDSRLAPWKLAMTTPSTVTVAPGMGVAAPFPCTSWMKATVTSSLVIVPRPWTSPALAPVMLKTLTKNVSLASGVMSRLTVTLKLYGPVEPIGIDWPVSVFPT